MGALLTLGNTEPKRCSCGEELLAMRSVVDAGVFYPAMCDGCAAKAQKEMETRERQGELDSLVGRANIPPVAQGVTLETAKNLAYPAAIAACFAWLDGTGGLYLHGPRGGGKTFLAWGCLRKSIETTMKTGFFLPVGAWMFSLKHAFHDAVHAEQSMDWERQARRAYVLIMDDLGAEKPTESSREALLAMLDHRINYNLRTIITSNFTPQGLDAKLGDETGRIVDRIIGHCQMVNVNHPSFREQAARGRK